MRIELLMAWPRRHEQRWVELPDGAMVVDALDAARWRSVPEVVGYAVHGQRVTADARLGEGDRIELLRPLALDPKEARRRRAAAATSGTAPGRKAGD